MHNGAQCKYIVSNLDHADDSTLFQTWCHFVAQAAFAIQHWRVLLSLNEYLGDSDGGEKLRLGQYTEVGDIDEGVDGRH